MSTRLRWIIGLCVSIMVLLVLIRFLNREPSCRGMLLSEWLAKSNHGNVGDGVAEIGPEAIPYLARAVKCPSPLWERFYPQFWQALPKSLRSRLRSPANAEAARQNALFALRESGPEAKSALPSVIRAARNDSSVLCRTFALNAAAAIGWDEPSVTALFADRLQDAKAADSAAVAPFNVARFPSNCLPQFIALLKAKQKLPYNALLGVSLLGPEASEALPVILPHLKDTNIQGNALTACFRMGPAAAPAVPALVTILETASPQLATQAAEALMNIGPGASNAIPALRRFVDHEDPTARMVAAAALARITGQTKESLRILTSGLEPGQSSTFSWTTPVRVFGLDHHAFNYKQTAAWMLGELAPDSLEALPALKACLAQCSETLAPVVARSVWRLDGRSEEVMPSLLRSLQAKDNETRVLACVALAEMGPAAAAALPGLEAACRTSLNTRQAARFAMSRIRPASTDRRGL